MTLPRKGIRTDRIYRSCAPGTSPSSYFSSGSLGHLSMEDEIRLQARYSQPDQTLADLTDDEPIPEILTEEEIRKYLNNRKKRSS